MFESLSDRLSGALEKLTGKGALTEADVSTALREVRVALLEADVSLPVARRFIKDVSEKATGQAVLKSVTPGQMVVKIVHDEMVRMLAGEGDGEAAARLKIDSPPATILMVGLQGSGKTTTTAKLARRLKERDGKRVLMASLDTRRPAAMEQLAVLGTQTGVDTLPIVAGQDPVAIAKRARQQAMLAGYDVVMLDTAGRLSIDEDLMAEVTAVRDAASPNETLLVVDGLTGQDAVATAENFDGRVGISGVILTRMDGDGRGGAALSMRAVTGKPIKFVGVGEKSDALEEFHAERVAGRILGMGDIVSLVEKAQEQIEQADAERMMKRFQKGRFDMNDLRSQLEQMQKMGGMESVMGMLPGMGKLAKQMGEAGIDDRVIKRQIAIIQSMTKEERKKPEILKASRKDRIAKGAGQQVQEVNKLLKMHRQMADMMKKVGKMGKGGMRALMGQMMGKGMPGAMGGGMPGMPGMPGLGGAGALPSGMGAGGGTGNITGPGMGPSGDAGPAGGLPGGLSGIGGGGMPGLPPGFGGAGSGSGARKAKGKGRKK